MDADDYYMTIHHKGTSYFDSAAHLMFCSLNFKRNDKLSFIVINVMHSSTT